MVKNLGGASAADLAQLSDVTKFAVMAKDFAKTIDGSADMASALQAAANQANTAFGSFGEDTSLQLPMGTIRIDSPVTIYTNMIGSNTIILLGSPDAQILLDNSGIELANFRVIPGYTGNGNVAAIEVINYRSFNKFRNLRLINWNSNKLKTGIKVYGLSSSFDNVRVSDPTDYGIQLTDNGGANDPNAISVSWCHLRNAGIADIYMDGGFSGTLTNNVTEGSAPIKVYIKNASSLHLVNPHVEHSGSGAIGIKIENCIDTEVQNPRLSTSTSGTDIQMINAASTILIGIPDSSSANGVTIDAACVSTLFVGGSIVTARISDLGTNTRRITALGHNPGSAAAPGFSFIGDSDTGFYNPSGGQVNLSLDGASRFLWSKGNFTAERLAGESGGMTITSKESGTSATAQFASSTSNGTHKFGANPANTARFSVFSVTSLELLTLADAPADGNTALLVRRNVGGTQTVQQVSMGAADSGGSGFKVLRVPN